MIFLSPLSLSGKTRALAQKMEESRGAHPASVTSSGHACPTAGHRDPAWHQVGTPGSQERCWVQDPFRPQFWWVACREGSSYRVFLFPCGAPMLCPQAVSGKLMQEEWKGGGRRLVWSWGGTSALTKDCHESGVLETVSLQVMAGVGPLQESSFVCMLLLPYSSLAVDVHPSQMVSTKMCFPSVTPQGRVAGRWDKEHVLKTCY